MRAIELAASIEFQTPPRGCTSQGVLITKEVEDVGLEARGPRRRGERARGLGQNQEGLSDRRTL